MADTEMEVETAPKVEDTPAPDNNGDTSMATTDNTSSANNGGNSSDPRTTEGAVAVRSIEGWIVIATNIHEEAAEADLLDVFGEYGEVKNMHMNLDRRSGFVKGYALIEYSTLGEARAAVAKAPFKVLGQSVGVDFAFVRPPPAQGGKGKGGDNRGQRRRQRSRSPEEREREEKDKEDD